jgi:hypothetical protein
MLESMTAPEPSYRCGRASVLGRSPYRNLYLPWSDYLISADERIVRKVGDVPKGPSPISFFSLNQEVGNSGFTGESKTDSFGKVGKMIQTTLPILGRR